MLLGNIPVFLSSNPGSTTYYMGELGQVIYRQYPRLWGTDDTSFLSHITG